VGVGAEDAAISRPRMQQRLAPFATVGTLARVHGHHLELGEPAHWAGDRRLGDERGHAWRNGLVKPVIPVRADCGGACPLVAGDIERSPDRVGLTPRATGAGESQDQSK